jgi:hypothetical protein
LTQAEELAERTPDTADGEFFLRLAREWAVIDPRHAATTALRAEESKVSDRENELRQQVWRAIGSGFGTLGSLADGEIARLALEIAAKMREKRLVHTVVGLAEGLVPTRSSIAERLLDATREVALEVSSIWYRNLMLALLAATMAMLDSNRATSRTLRILDLIEVPRSRVLASSRVALALAERDGDLATSLALQAAAETTQMTDHGFNRRLAINESVEALIRVGRPAQAWELVVDEFTTATTEKEWLSAAEEMAPSIGRTGGPKVLDDVAALVLAQDEDFALPLLPEEPEAKLPFGGWSTTGWD